MEGLIDGAKKFMNSDQGKQIMEQAEKQFGGGSGSGDQQQQQQQQQGSTDAFGNPGAPGQYGQAGQYGAVTGQGFGAGAGLAKDRDGNQLAAPQQQQQQGSTDAFGNPGAPGQYGQPGQYGAVTGQGFGAGAGLAKDRDGNQLAAPQQQQQGGGGERERRMSAYEGYDGDSTASGGWGRNAQGGSFSRQNQMGADNTNAAFGNGADDDDNEGYKTGTSTPGYRQEGDVDAEAAENRMRNANMNVYGQQANDLRNQNDLNEQDPNI